MTSPDLPRNAYTDAPEQHHNLILGSLQLLFWLIFRPSAWRNYLRVTEYVLYLKYPRASTRSLRWRDPSLAATLNTDIPSFAYPG
jgi:hypothetical protein